MTIGPPDPDEDFCPTQMDQVIALPFTLIMFIPVVSGEHVPLGIGSDVGVVPPPARPPPASGLCVLPELDPELPERDEPLLEPLPELPDPVLEPPLEDPPELPLPLEKSDPLEFEPLEPLVPSEPDPPPLPEPLLPGGVKSPCPCGVEVPHATAAPNPIKPSKTRARRMTALPGLARPARDPISK